LRLAPGVVLRVSFALLLAVTAFGLAQNLPVITNRSLLPEPAAAAGGPPLRFVIVAPQVDHPFWLQVQRGAETAAAGLRVSVELTGPRRASLEEQVQLVDTATAAQVDGILTQGVPDPRLAEAIGRAADRGIPVITIGTDLPGRRLAYVGSDNRAAGRRAAAELLRRSDGTAVVGIVRGDFGAAAQDERVLGFREGLADAPGVRIIDSRDSGLSRSAAGQAALGILTEHPEVTALYGTTALDAVGIAQSVAARGLSGRVLVIGWDYVDDAAEYLNDGTIGLLISEEPEEMGRLAVDLLEAYLRRDVRPLQSVFTHAGLQVGGRRT